MVQPKLYYLFYLGLEYHDAFRIAALKWCHQIISSFFLLVFCEPCIFLPFTIPWKSSKLERIPLVFPVYSRLDVEIPVVSGMISSLGILDSGDLRSDVQVLLTRRALEKKRKGEERNGSKTKFLLFQRWCQIYIGSMYSYLPLQFREDEGFSLLFFRWVRNQLVFDLLSHGRG